MKKFAPLSSLRTLSVQPTQQCNAACEHCGTFSNPNSKTRLNTDLAEAAIRQAAEHGFTDVVLTGGEATLMGQWLPRAIAQVKSLGMKARLVTNGWWAKSAQSAARRSREFAAAGLDEINFSTGDQHARFVPLETVVRGVCAAVHSGMKVTIIVELVKSRQITKAMIEAMPQIRALRESGCGSRLSIYQNPWMPIDPGTVESYPAGVAANGGNLAGRGGCDDVLQTITISPDGVISACCGIGMRLIPELQLGNIADTSIAEACRKAEVDPLKWRLRHEGPEKMLAHAATADPSIEWENMYAHRCQACIRMYRDPKIRSALEQLDSQALPATSP